ncbi:hypothetical protein IKF23_02010 [Candidatus Saccharibacteria bacterium]|nr:hypothetical protein [Candidatus Saccharibacteria bacterium]
MPSHNHPAYIDPGFGAYPGSSNDWKQNLVNSSHPEFGNNAYHNQSVGGGQPHQNMPPYQTLYLWKRTA